jgi:small GTP-binding protein
MRMMVSTHCGLRLRLRVLQLQRRSLSSSRLQPLLSNNKNRFFSSVSSASQSPSSSSAEAVDCDSSKNNSNTGLFRLLSPTERSLLHEQRALTTTARALAQTVGLSYHKTDYYNTNSTNNSLSPNANAVLEASSAFCVVVAGEFNAGKSTLINALIGSKLLETGSLPTTDTITILSHINQQQQDEHDDQSTDPTHPSQPRNKTNTSTSTTTNSGILQYAVDLPLLEDLTLVDTPGTNAAVDHHTETTIRLLPSADLILFVTSADRPMPDSERQLLKQVSELYRKSVAVVINKMDVLEDAGGDHGARDKQAVVSFVTEHCREWLGAQPAVIAVSSRDALAAKLTGRAVDDDDDDDEQSMSSTSTSSKNGVWRRSNFRQLEGFLKQTLSTPVRIQAKLSSPVHVAAGLLQQCLTQLQTERSDLETDVATLHLLHSQFAAWRSELQQDMERARQELTSTCLSQGDRCHVLLRRASLWQLYQWTLLSEGNNNANSNNNNSRLQREWDKTQTIYSPQADLDVHLLDMVRDMADSIAVKGRAQGQSVIEFLGQRPAVRHKSLVGSVTNASRFEDTRDNLTEHMSEAVRRNIDANIEVEEARVLHGLRQSVWWSLGLNAGALGSALAMGVQLLDPVTGIVACSTLAASSGLVLSRGPPQIAKQHRELWESRSRNLDEALEVISVRELDRVDRRIRDGVAPYMRFVEAEQERIDRLTRECEDVLSESHRLRKRISKLQFKD